MKLQNRTILITGGGSGIGFELAKLLSQQENKLIICGRNEQKLKKAIAEIPNGEYIVCDVSQEKDIMNLYEKILKNFPSFDVLVNNAGVGFAYDPANKTSLFNNATTEMETNYLSVIRINEAFLPLLLKQKEAAIIHISSPLALAPSFALPTYSASKAALHSYIKWLRWTLKGKTVKVFEVLPPVVDTFLSDSLEPKNKWTAGSVARAISNGIQKNKSTIKIGIIRTWVILNRFAPQLAQKIINKATRLKQ